MSTDYNILPTRVRLHKCEFAFQRSVNNGMPEDRCFRITEDDIDELKDRTRDQLLIEAYKRWVDKFAPKLDQIIGEVRTAFHGVQLGEGIGLFEAKGLDDFASDEERVELRAKDEKHDWQRISPTDLARCSAAPFFFDLAGFIFHLPAFLIAELNDEHPYGFIDRLCRFDVLPKGWHELLTMTQRNAIALALIMVTEHPDYSTNQTKLQEVIRKLETGVA